MIPISYYFTIIYVKINDSAGLNLFKVYQHTLSSQEQSLGPFFYFNEMFQKWRGLQ